MNYYIQGDAARAEEIKAAFESKGFKFLMGSPSADVCNYHYTFITKKGFPNRYNDNLVYCIPRGEWEAQVILNHPDYKELDLPVNPHYDISNFKPFQKVLVRNYDTDTWTADWFSHYVDDEDGIAFVATCSYRNQCIPFEGNEHLLGTTDMPSEEYINW